MLRFHTAHAAQWASPCEEDSERKRSGRDGVTMATAPTVHTLQAKSHDPPDEVRAPDKTRVEVIRLDAFNIVALHLPTGMALVGVRQALAT